ncbi:hypothetical protein EVAR_102880_1 [Eumeta japonica]|uniref:Uncharacterized protein n=1 Tax=Eumeta variegata TaxID=151549 RepID=A0A4C1UNS1_EUMVA|nr:hypothetical protein EVAR_102880_1 [Eumeta japonica]
MLTDRCGLKDVVSRVKRVYVEVIRPPEMVLRRTLPRLYIQIAQSVLVSRVVGTPDCCPAAFGEATSGGFLLVDFSPHSLHAGVCYAFFASSSSQEGEKGTQVQDMKVKYPKPEQEELEIARNDKN